jgi:hypothetical protein
MRNPFSHHHLDTAHMQRELREAYAKQEWGTTIVRTVPRPEGDPLAFQFSLPDDEKLLEASELAGVAASVPDMPAWVGDRALDLTAAAQAPGVILVGAIVRAADPSEVFATVTAFASENVGPLGLTVGVKTPDGGDVPWHHEWDDPEFGHLDQYVVGYRPGEPSSVLMALYHFVNEGVGGKYSLTFASSHGGMGGERGFTYVTTIAKSLWYGPQDAPE